MSKFGVKSFTISLSAWGKATVLSTALAVCGPAPAQTAAARPLPELLAQKRWPEALAAIDQALKERPKDMELLLNRGAVLSNLNRDGEALQVFKAVAAANPKSPAAHNNMAVILAAMGRTEEAKAALRQALKAQPGYATAHENLGDLYAHQAAEAYRKALEIDPAMKSAKAKLNLTADIIALATGVRPQAPATAVGAVAPAGPAMPSLAAASAAPAAPQAQPTPKVQTATPAAAASPSAASAAGVATAEVEAAVQAWARSWARRDGPRYVAAYEPDYKGGTDTPAIWRELAQKRLHERSSIRVDVSQLNVSVDGDTAQARFEQTYESDQAGSRMRTRKTLVLQRTGSAWLIREEIRN